LVFSDCYAAQTSREQRQDGGKQACWQRLPMQAATKTEACHTMWDCYASCLASPVPLLD